MIILSMRCVQLRKSSGLDREERGALTHRHLDTTAASHSVSGSTQVT